MNSILGKTLTAILVVLAAVGVVAAFSGAFEQDRTSTLVASVSSTELNIKADYLHNPHGYASLTPASVMAAHEAPQSIIHGGKLLSPWGQAMGVQPIDSNGSPVSSGYAPDFQIGVGSLPQDICAKAVMGIRDLMAVNISGTEYDVPTDPAQAASICSGNPAVTFQFGKQQIVGKKAIQVTLGSTSPAINCIVGTTAQSTFASDLSTMASNIMLDNAPTGYANVSTSSVIATYEAPQDLVSGNQLVSPWGGQLDVYPVDQTGSIVGSGTYALNDSATFGWIGELFPSADAIVMSGGGGGSTGGGTYVPDFAIDLGPMCQSSCAAVVENLSNAAAVRISGTEYSPTTDPAIAKAMCANNSDVALQFGGYIPTQPNPPAVIVGGGGSTASAAYPANGCLVYDPSITNSNTSTTYTANLGAYTYATGSNGYGAMPLYQGYDFAVKNACSSAVTISTGPTLSSSSIFNLGGNTSDYAETMCQPGVVVQPGQDCWLDVFTIAQPPAGPSTTTIALTTRQPQSFSLPVQVDTVNDPNVSVGPTTLYVGQTTVGSTVYSANNYTVSTRSSTTTPGAYIGAIANSANVDVTSITGLTGTPFAIVIDPTDPQSYSDVPCASQPGVSAGNCISTQGTDFYASFTPTKLGAVTVTATVNLADGTSFPLILTGTGVASLNTSSGALDTNVSALSLSTIPYEQITNPDGSLLTCQTYYYPFTYGQASEQSVTTSENGVSGGTVTYTASQAASLVTADAPTPQGAFGVMATDLESYLDAGNGTGYSPASCQVGSISLATAPNSQGFTYYTSDISCSFTQVISPSDPSGQPCTAGQIAPDGTVCPQPVTNYFVNDYSIQSDAVPSCNYADGAVTTFPPTGVTACEAVNNCAQK